MKSIVFDISAVLGIALITYGGGQMFSPMFWIIPGVALLCAGVLGANKWAS